MKRAFFTLAILFLLASCDGDNSIADSGETKRTAEGQGFGYTILQIEGMTCVWVVDTSSDYGYAGLTCNWSEWKGSK